MSRFEFLCLTPPGAPDPAIAIAASRAGACGLLDLELCADEAAARAAIARLARLARRPFGLRLDARRPEFGLALLADLPESARTVLLAAPADAGPLAALAAAARARGARVLVEAVSVEEAALAVAIEADGVVAKGHEAAGRVGEETTFILVQRLVRGRRPVYAQGGLGLHSVAAVFAAGAAGAVLDAACFLAAESSLPRAAREMIARLDGGETAALGMRLGEGWRVVSRPGHPGVEALARRESELLADTSLDSAARRAVFASAVAAAAGWDDPRRQVALLGQDAAFAAGLARRFRTVAGILEGLGASLEEHVRVAAALAPLDENGPLARSHGTAFPIVQGPMTRVSDTAQFAAEVAKAGGLPFLALALLRAAEVRALLEKTREVVGERPWGIGILGFVPLELRQEQLEAVRACPPPFALIAGGRPDQARVLEDAGIATYLHVPSPGLLRMFLAQGARRFVFEGRECGGHVGPRASFVLWETMIATLLEELPAGEAGRCHVLFAGGVHDALSASMVAAMAAPLADRGVKIGVLMGTAYLFTHEAVTSGAIVPGFQEAAVGCARTVLLETGPGHSTRCVDSPYAGAFEAERRRLVAAGAPAEETREALEALNLGRLRLASKGVDRHPRYGVDPAAPRLREVPADEQKEQGMFMIGQVAALRDRTLSMTDLHRDVAIEGTRRLKALAAPAPAIEAVGAPPEKPSDVAIVGISTLLPKAPHLRAFWENILERRDALTEVPPDRWDWRLYYDTDRAARDKVYSKWGGFIDDTPFDPMRYGITPNSIPSIEPVQLLLLDVVREGLKDAGYLDRPFPRRRASVILGAGGGISELGSLYTFRSLLPSYIQDPPPALMARLPEWTEDSFPGILLNVAAGRVANRFDLGGVNFTVDAACASSLAAIYLAVRELESGGSDMVITGGIDTAQNPFMFLCFSKTHAHSPTGRCSTFDENSDGIAISEGIAILVLKRLADAERDGDRIYAVIKAVGGSSDGRDRGLTAPRPEGQMKALERAYGKAGVSPATVGLIEAHGTGTVAGDQAEVTTLRRVFEAAGAAPGACAIGSVKSMIGHTKCAAGVAGLAKVALALHHQVLPPTLHVRRPNPKAGFPGSPFYVNSEARPWLAPADGSPRRAGVSAFGFGGTNFHAVVEEYRDGVAAARDAVSATWPAELYLWRGRTRADLAGECGRIGDAIAAGARPEPAELARAVGRRAMEREGLELTLAIVATSIDDLAAKIGRARERLAAGADAIADPAGIHFASTPFGRDGRVAFLFPGQGSQSVNMLRDLAMHFPEVRSAFEDAGEALGDRLGARLGDLVFPAPWFTPEEERARQEAVTATNVAQPALGAAGLGALRLLGCLGVRPDMAAGHSYGEYVALAAAGVLDPGTLAHLSERRGHCIIEAARDDLGTMAAVPAGAEEVGAWLRDHDDVWVANLNAPRQTVISGTRAGVERAVQSLAGHGVAARRLPVACAFHSPVIAGARDRLAEELRRAPFAAPAFDVYSNCSAAAYPAAPEAIRELLAGHLVRPVRFVEQIVAMHQAGARLFVEAGPRSVLTGLTQQILADRPHLAVAIDVPGRHGIVQLQHALAQLAAHGVRVDLDRLHSGRASRVLDLARLVEETTPQPLPPTTWLINGAYARPHRQPKRALAPLALGPAAAGAGATVAPPADAPRVAAPQDAAPQETGREAVAPPVVVAPVGTLRADAAPAGGTPLAAPHRAVPQSAAIAAPGAPDPAGMPIPDAAIQVVTQFQELMTRFLETQRAVMESYLSGAPAGAIASHVEPAVPLPETAPAMTAAAAASDIGSRPAAVPPPAPAPAPAPVAAPPAAAPVVPAAAASRDDLTRRLVAIVSERTGYPPEMIDLDAAIEADLGIDSIKRVEILGALQRALPAGDGERVQGAMESLTRARSLRALVDAAVAPAGAPGTGAAAGAPTTRTQAAPATANAPAAAPSAPAAAPAPAAPPAISRDDLTRRVVAIVSERTGYPPEMIDLDAAIEADLGIDSIKRVEILGALQRALPAGDGERVQGAMESLTRARSLRALVDAAVAPADVAPADVAPAHVAPAAPAPVTRAAASAGPAPADDDAPVPRFLLRAVESGPAPEPPARLDGEAFLITDDEGGTSVQLAGALRARGASVVILRAAADGGSRAAIATAAPAIAIDFADAGAIRRAVEAARGTLGAITGIIHLLPLRGPAEVDLAGFDGWRRRLAQEVKGLFHLARAAGADIRGAGARGRVIAATAMGGHCGLPVPGGAGISPAGGGVAGLVKTIALEWEGVACRVVDFDAETPAAGRAARILGEMTVADRVDIEVGWRSGRRHVLRPVLAPLPAGDPAGGALDGGSVVLVTGGARGITAEVALELARRIRPTLVIAGRSPLPEENEPPLTAGLRSEADLRAALLREMTHGGAGVTPAAVDKAVQRLVQERETRANLAAMRDTGARVEYRTCDVRDPQAVAALLDAIDAGYGPVDAVIHGAGLIEDRLIESKDPESFDRVFDTKADSVFVLLGRLRLDALKVFAAFTSVAGRFGNRGQADYAAGNEVVNRLLAAVDRRLPGRVVGLDWGPWKTTGMASPAVQRQFEARGVRLVPPASGRRAAVDEILRGRKGDTEVVLGDGPWRAYVVDAAPAPAPVTEPRGAGAAPRAPAPPGALPLLDGQRVSAGPGGSIEIVRLLDPAHDLFLVDHMLDGKPVLPAAVAMELMAETARRGWPEFEVASLDSFRVLGGVVLEKGPRPVKVVARAETQPDSEGAGLAVDVQIVDPERGRAYYRGTIVLALRLPDPPASPLGPLSAARPFPMSVESAYREWLFHGPVFQGIRSIEAVGPEGISGVIAPSDPGACVRAAAGGWLIDPVVVDSAFQLGILYARSEYDITPLPARFRRYTRFAPLDQPRIGCEFRSRAAAPDASVLEIQIALLGRDGRLLGLIQDMELSCSRELNRLAKRGAGGPPR